MRTFIDANILIAAATGRDALFDRAWAMLDDPERVFFTSEFVRLGGDAESRLFSAPG